MSTPARRRGLEAAVAGTLLLVALLTLSPTGAGGWAWGDPATELHWYATAASSGTAAAQLLGNLLLVAPTAVLAVLRWPALRRPAVLLVAAFGAGVVIELTQWALPLGRVVSPVDALLNGVGAVVAGGLVAGVLRSWRAGSGGPQRVWAGA